MEKKPSITTVRHGPFIVANLAEMTDLHGKVIGIKSPVSLCRCGESKEQPYCDGGHTAAGFKDDMTFIDRSDSRTYVGREITIHYNNDFCSHPAYCLKQLPTVFHRLTHPWITPDGASVERIVEVIEKCPTGALSYTLNGVHHDHYFDRTSLKVNKNGPMDITGSIVLDDPRQPPSAEHYSLCRCGISKNKPFCDGEHRKKRFMRKSIISSTGETKTVGKSSGIIRRIVHWIKR